MQRKKRIRMPSGAQLQYTFTPGVILMSQFVPGKTCLHDFRTPDVTTILTQHILSKVGGIVKLSKQTACKDVKQPKSAYTIIYIT